jgi:hypothetical protein
MLSMLEKHIDIDPQPIPRGAEWHVLAWHPNGAAERIRGFKSATDAKRWILTESAAWRRAHGDDLRLI